MHEVRIFAQIKKFDPDPYIPTELGQINLDPTKSGQIKFWVQNRIQRNQALRSIESNRAK